MNKVEEAVAVAIYESSGAERDPTYDRVHSSIQEGFHSIARQAIQAHIAALEASGFAIVPIVPTQAMIVAGASGSGEDSTGVASGAWEAMIEAWSKQPKEINYETDSNINPNV